MTASGSGTLLALLHLCDSLFPLGSFAHSDGLESASSSGRIAGGAELRPWLIATRDDVLAGSEGPGLRIAYEAFSCRGFEEIARVDDELHAMRPAMAGRQASRAMGTRLLKTWQEIRPEAASEGLQTLDNQAVRPAGFTLPVAFGVVCAASGVSLGSALEGYFYTRLAATVSAAMRLMSLGQHEAHALLAEALGGVPAAVSDAMRRREPTSFVPALDLAAMSQQYVHSRLFRS
jgi:urease accessory protein